MTSTLNPTLPKSQLLTHAHIHIHTHTHYSTQLLDEASVMKKQEKQILEKNRLYTYFPNHASDLGDSPSHNPNV